MFFLLIIISILLILSFLVIFSKNTIVSMLCLIWCFVLSGFFFLLLGAEFLTYTLIIVYGSAVSILFLFVIMLLNLRLMEIYYINFYYIPLCIFLSLLLIILFNLLLLENYSFFFYNNLILDNNNTFFWLNYLNIFKYNSNLYNFGIILYNYYYIFVIISSLILLLAMLGSILMILDNKIDNSNYLNIKKVCIIKHYTINKLNNVK